MLEYLMATDPSQSGELVMRAHGDVASTLLACNMDYRALRPYVAEDNRTYITQVHNGVAQAVPCGNVATLTHEDWRLIDRAVEGVKRERLTFVDDLRGAGMQFTMPNGMAHTVLTTQRMSDTRPARVGMDPTVESENDALNFDLVNLPLPVIYKGFNLPLRTVAESRNGSAPLDTTLAEESARKVLETAEQLALGTLGANSFGGYVLQGATNFTGRMTKVLTTPTGTATNATTLTEILAMKDQAKAAHHHGPFRLYMGTSWDPFLDSDFSTAYPGITLRERLMKIDQIQKIATVDFLPGFNALLIEQSKSTMRIVVGMELTTLRWQTMGGLKLHFLVMAILVPQLRADFNGNTGIVHGNVA